MNWTGFRADGSQVDPLVNEARRARVLELWRAGKDTFSISQELDVREAEICRLLRDARASEPTP